MAAVADDPLARLENLAKHQAAEKKAAANMTQARVKLVLGKDAKSAFFATLALRLKLEPDWDCETAKTNGKLIRYNPSYVNDLSPEQRIGLVVHEVMHCSNAHQSRRGQREPKQWNIAGDLAINDLIREAGYSLPPGGLYPGDGEYANIASGLSAEEIYSLLPPDDKGGKHGDDPGGCGAVEDAGDGDQADAAMSEGDWKVAVGQASNVAQQRGELPGGLARMVGQVLDPETPWQDVLRDFLSTCLMARDDYTWRIPNRRFIGQGLYLPSLRSETMGHIVVAIDTSGSIDDTTLAKFGAECNGILGCHPCRVSVVYCDARVQHVDNWTPNDGELVLQAHGGGGTDHQPVWNWLRDECDEDPACVVCLTDGYTSFGNPPDVPVLWAISPNGMGGAAPFGRTIKLK
jgi:predicted metal-dependent peptidase